MTTLVGTRYNLTQARHIAIGAAIIELKHQGFNLSDISVQDLWRALDELNRKDADLIASIWYRETSENRNQTRLFKKEARKRLQRSNKVQFTSIEQIKEYAGRMVSSDPCSTRRKAHFNILSIVQYCELYQENIHIIRKYILDKLAITDPEYKPSKTVQHVLKWYLDRIVA